MFGQSYLHPQQQQIQYQSKIHSIEDYVAMLVEDADKLLEDIATKLSDESINDYTVNKSPQLSLPLFPSNKEQENM